MNIKKYLIILLLLIGSYAYALTLEGSVIEKAQKDAFSGCVYNIDTAQYKAYAYKTPKGYRKDYSDGRYSISIGNKMYGYKNGELYIIGISDKTATEYPRKSYRYDYPSGKLNSVSYLVSPSLSYIFNSDGTLHGTWKDDTFYEKGNTKLYSKTTNF